MYPQPDDAAQPWRVAEFISSADPRRKVLMIAIGDAEIEAWGKRGDFCRWMTPAPAGTLLTEHVSDSDALNWTTSPSPGTFELFSYIAPKAPADSGQAQALADAELPPQDALRNQMAYIAAYDPDELDGGSSADGLKAASRLRSIIKRARACMALRQPGAVEVAVLRKALTDLRELHISTLRTPTHFNAYTDIIDKVLAYRSDRPAQCAAQDEQAAFEAWWEEGYGDSLIDLTDVKADAWNVWQARASLAPPAPAAQPASLFDRKLADLEQRGYEVIGRILYKDGQYALFDSSCRWLTKPQYQRLMHEQDDSLFGAAQPEAKAAPVKVAITKEWCERMAKLEVDSDSNIEAGSSAGNANGVSEILRDMLAIQEACGLHTDEYAPGSVIEYIKELEADAAGNSQGQAAPADYKKLPTDLSHRLRETADQQPGWKPLLTAAADEIERFYGGMMAWKQTAEKKDADWNAERMGRVDDRIAARNAAQPEQQPVAEVAEDFVFMLRKQKNGERWPVGTKLYAAPVPAAAPEPDIAAMVNRFLGWPLPKTFSPDCGISFDGRKDDEWNKNKTWPIGTNLFTADEAKAMFEHAIGKARP